jgi:hypothetical protein
LTERPHLLLIAGLAALGAIVVLADLLRSVDRLRMATTTGRDIDRLPLTTDDDEGEE